MPRDFPLLLDRILLRPLEEGDKESVRAFAGDPEISRVTRSLTYPEDSEKASAWVDEHIAMTRNGQTVSAAILEKKHRRFVGAGILFLEPNHRRAEIGLWLGRPFWAQGYGPEACRGLIDYAFAVLQLKKVCAYCLASNLRSRHLIQKLGFRWEGTQRKQLLVRGVFEDLLLFGLLAEEWTPLSHRKG
ncbi:GNAT family N-acetyltransferase [Methylacidimicrobium tartarophylax]|uniref:Diamine N-acetyltransferase n=1 Tax=Methylacidimicrobium tartarophylax TaxID=1041768 RepID=A0A5E6M6V7_9BACT|nr:GNAT family N-acetyltransferase [Methylacidimicrobium tartarophylax]VVM04680.1 diamine N-acetyltransferase [Methylacidimicrobium tartarophylax]